MIALVLFFFFLPELLLAPDEGLEAGLLSPLGLDEPFLGAPLLGAPFLEAPLLDAPPLTAPAEELLLAGLSPR